MSLSVSVVETTGYIEIKSTKFYRFGFANFAFVFIILDKKLAPFAVKLTPKKIPPKWRDFLYKLISYFN